LKLGLLEQSVIASTTEDALAIGFS